MKELNNDVEIRKEDEQEKRSYQTPKLNSLKLFADHVLVGNLIDINQGCGGFSG